MTPRLLSLLASTMLAVTGFCWSATAEAQSERARSSRLEIGVTHVLTSKSLGEQRTVNVVLPAGYQSHPTRRYPVLYLIDGGLEQDLIHIAGVVRLGALWGRSGEAIVVGIETKDRRRELTGPTTDPELLGRYPTAGSSAAFREFIRTEVKPLIEAGYRTSGRDVVMGESLAGLFVVETYLVDPTLFGAYGAVDPSLWWDKEALSKAAAAKLGKGQRGRSLLIAIAKEQSEEPSAYQRLAASLREATLPLCLVLRLDQTHATIYQQVSPVVVQHLLPPADPAPTAYGFRPGCPDAP